MNATDLMQPTVNINGTSRESLLDQKRTVLDALSRAKETLARTAPHGRDYQLAENLQAALDRDVAIYRARYAALDAIYEAVMNEALGLMSNASPRAPEPRFVVKPDLCSWTVFDTVAGATVNRYGTEGQAQLRVEDLNAKHAA